MSDGVELRVDLDADHPAIAVMDAIVQATQQRESRSSITRRVLAEWAEREIHRATLIVRIAGVNGTASAQERKQ